MQLKSLKKGNDKVVLCEFTEGYFEYTLYVFHNEINAIRNYTGNFPELVGIEGTQHWSWEEGKWQ